MEREPDLTDKLWRTYRHNQREQEDVWGRRPASPKEIESTLNLAQTPEVRHEIRHTPSHKPGTRDGK